MTTRCACAVAFKADSSKNRLIPGPFFITTLECSMPVAQDKYQKSRCHVGENVKLGQVRRRRLRGLDVWETKPCFSPSPFGSEIAERRSFTLNPSSARAYATQSSLANAMILEFYCCEVISKEMWHVLNI